MPRRALAFLLGIAHKGRRKQAAAGSPFLWILAFGEAKESISPSGARTRLNHASQERHNRINQRALHNGA